MGVKDRRASDGNRRLLVSWKMCYGRFVETCSSVDIDRIDNVICIFPSVERL